MDTRKASRAEVIDAIYFAIDGINQERPSARQVKKSPRTIFFGDGGQLDSLELVRMILALEETIEDHFDTAITIADARAMSQKNSPFRNVDTLANYILVLLKEGEDV